MGAEPLRALSRSWTLDGDRTSCKPMPRFASRPGRAPRPALRNRVAVDDRRHDGADGIATAHDFRAYDAGPTGPRHTYNIIGSGLLINLVCFRVARSLSRYDITLYCCRQRLPNFQHLDRRSDRARR